MLDKVKIGASVRMTPKEVHTLAGDGPVRLVSCPNGRIVGGMGPVGFVEHVGVTDLQAFIDEVKTRRAALAEVAAGPQPDNPRANLYEFIHIG